MKKLLKIKVGNRESDTRIEQWIVWIGGIAFFILMVGKLTSLKITEFELIVGVILSAIFMVLCTALGYIIPFFSKTNS